MKIIGKRTGSLAWLLFGLGAFCACDSKYTIIEAFLQNSAETKLFSYGGNSYGLGGAVAISGNVALVEAYLYRWDGVTWTKEANLSHNGRAVALNNNIAVVGAGSSVYVYRFNGSRWQEEAALKSENGKTVNAVAVSRDLIAVGENSRSSSSIGGNQSPEAGAIYIYRFDGSSWTQEAKLTAGTQAYGFGYSVSISGNAVVAGAWGVDGQAEDTGIAYVYRFTGTRWQEEARLIASDAAQGDQFGRAVAVSGDVAIVGAPYDGESWSQTGLNNVPVRAFAINSAGHIFAGYIGVYRSTDNGKNWNIVNRGLTDLNVHALIIIRDGHIFAGTSGGRVFRSTDNGDNWNQINSGVINADVKAFVINSNGHIYAGAYGYADTYGGVFRSIDKGNNWSPINTGLTNTEVNALTINSQEHIFAGTSGGGVFRSTNNGGNWIPINTGLTNIRVFAFAINRDGHIFAGTLGGGVFRSTNNGDNWIPINTGLADLNIQALAINNDGHIFAGTYFSGMFRSTNNGDSWTEINSGLTDLNVQALAVNNDGHIFVGTYGDGVFRSPNNGAFSENSGSAYLFRYNGSAWRQEAKLSLVEADRAYFGSAVAVEGNMAIIGSPFIEDRYYESGAKPGSAYAYRWDGNIWREQKKLAASDGTAGDRFGGAVSISGNLAIVGAPDAAMPNRAYAYSRGAAYVYVIN